MQQRNLHALGSDLLLEFSDIKSSMLIMSKDIASSLVARKFLVNILVNSFTMSSQKMPIVRLPTKSCFILLTKQILMQRNLGMRVFKILCSFNFVLLDYLQIHVFLFQVCTVGEYLENECKACAILVHKISGICIFKNQFMQIGLFVDQERTFQ